MEIHEVRTNARAISMNTETKIGFGQRVKQKIQNVATWIAGSFESGPHGASARKLTAFSCVMFAGYCHRYITPETATTFQTIDLATALIALGIVTMDQIIRLKTGQPENKIKSTNES